METYDWLETIRLNLLIFKWTGLWPDENYKFNSYLLLFIAINFTFVLIQSFCHTWKLITNLNDLEIVAGTAFLSMSECLVVIKIYYMTINMKNLKRLISVLQSEIFQPQHIQQIELIKPDLKMWKLMYNLLGGCITVTISIWASVPVLTKSLKMHRLPFIAWYPYDTTKTPFYEITYFHQVASVLYMAYCNVNLDTFIAAFSLYAGAQLDILSDNLKRSRPENFQKNLVTCIKRHREIIKFVKTYNSAFNWIIIVQFFTSAVSLGLTMFLITLVEPLSGEFWSFFLYGNAVLLEIFIFCWFGNELSFKSRQVFFTIFESQWVEASPEAKKTLLIFMLKTQKLFKISAHDLFDLNLETFFKILKTAYSYFALANRLNSK